MKNKGISTTTFTLIIAVALAMFAQAAFPGSMSIPQGATCHECGMKVAPDSAFSAQIIHEGRLLPYCDIGDMMVSYKEMEKKPSEVYVRDMGSLEWIDALKAVYVVSKEFSTPMGWDMAAFSSKDSASSHGTPLSFEEAMGSLGTPMKKGMKGMKGKM